MTLAATTPGGHKHVKPPAMSGIGRSIRISGEGDLQALQQAVWEHVQSAWRMWSVPGELGSEVSGYLSSIRDQLEGGDSSSLSWSFPSQGGACTTSMLAVSHWLDLALASDWRGLCDLADQHGFEVESEPLVIACDAGLVVLRGHLWRVEAQRLLRDGAVLPLAELGESERTRALQARAGCLCQACTFVRPDPSIAQAFTRELSQGPGPEVLDSLAWYIRRMKAPPSELLAAMGQAIERQPAHSRPLLDAMEALGPRVAAPDRGWPAGLALTLAWREGREAFDRQEALEALRAPAPASGLAAEVVARHLREERDTLWPSLVQVLTRPDPAEDIDEETRHRVVLALVNLYLPRGPVPPEVLALFQREAARDPEAQGPSAASLARWAVGVYGPSQNAK
jgi:hypothetical protein